MSDSYSEFNQEKYEQDLRAAKWFAQELIDSSYSGPCHTWLFKMESEYRSSFRAIVGYYDENIDKYIPGYLDKDIPFWQSVEEALISCMKEYQGMAIRHPNNTFYLAVVDAADTILEYLVAGLPTGD